MINRAFGENDIVLYVASDDNYVPFLLVMLNSVIKNVSNTNNYDILVFELSMSEENRKLIELQGEDYPNVSIRVIHIMDEIHFDESNLVARTLTKEIWLKALGIYALINYEKAIVMDCDVICCNDFVELYNFELGENLIGAVKFLNMEIYKQNNFLNRRYIAFKDSQIDCRESYFNYGVVLQNLKEFRKKYSLECFLKIVSEQTYPVQDQDLMNVLCKNKVAWIDAKWNTYPFLPEEFENTISMISEKDRKYWINGYKNPACIHYTTPVKPWLETKGAYSYSARYFWKHAIEVKKFDFNWFVENARVYENNKRFFVEIMLKSYDDLEIELKNKKLFVYGYGFRGKQILSENKYDISGFIDSNKLKHDDSRSISIGGIDMLEDIENSIVLIANDKWEQIALFLRKSGIKSIYADAALKKRDYLSWEVNEGDYGSVSKCFSLFEDEKSRQVFDTILFKRNHQFMDRTIKYLDIQEGNQYFRDDFFEITDEEIYADIGAYSGYTINAFIKHTSGRFKKIYGFEMSRNNFEKLVSNVVNSKVSLFNVAVTSSKGKQNYFEAGYHSELCKEYGTNSINTDRLDNLIPDRITFIKINTKNVKDVILGAKRILRTDQPKLAIDVSNNYSDLWEVALTIKQININYKFYLRHHMSDYTNTVLYAV